MLAVLASSVTAWAQANADEPLETRLEAVLAATDGLENVLVEVNSGVVTLHGEVASSAAGEKALSMVSAMEGVVTVNDRLAVNLRLEDRVEPILTKLRERFQDLLGLLPLIGMAVIVIVGFFLLGRSISRWDWPFRRLVKNPFLRDLSRTVVFALIAFLGLLIALEILDATALLGAALGTAGVLGLALGFALRDTIENYLAGILLSVRQPFSPHDHVALEGHEGQVIRLTSRATILLTFDGNHVRIPNAVVFKSTMVNFSRNHMRRFEFEVGVDSAVDLNAARTLATDTLEQMQSVLADPAPTAMIKSLGDSNVVLLIQGWVDQTQASFGKVKSEAIRLVKEAFDHANYEMPEPIYRLRMENVSRGDTPGPVQGAVTTRSSAPVPARSPSRELEEGDTTPEHDIHRQVAEERMADTQEDLLSASAPKE